MSWNEEKIQKLKDLWGKGSTASQSAEIIGGISRNAVIGKAHRLQLSSKIKTRTAPIRQKHDKDFEDENSVKVKRGRKSKFKSLIIEKDFEPENPKKLEDLDDNSCKWPIGHPEEESFYFCGRSSLKDFSYCKLHLLYAYQPKGKKEDVNDKDNEVPQYNVNKKTGTA
jgi:GcrA cell cycle regulator